MCKKMYIVCYLLGNEEKIGFFFFLAKKKYRITNQKLINVMTWNEIGAQERSGSEILIIIPFYIILKFNYINHIFKTEIKSKGMRKAHAKLKYKQKQRKLNVYQIDFR